MSALKKLEDVLYEQLQDIKSAETQLVKALPKMSKHATSEALKEAFQMHLEETKGQVERLERVGEAIGKKITAKTCKGMEGLLTEGSELFEADGDPVMIDLALIAAAQRVEHYEIAAYGTVCAMASQLGQTEAESELRATLEEESSANEKLTDIAESLYQTLA